MNTWHGAGRIGGDAVTRQTKNGDKVTGFSVAIDERRGGEKTTLWANCSMWGERGEKLAQYLTKGTSVAVAGPISLDVYEGKPQLRVDVREVTLLGSPEKSQGRANEGGRKHGGGPVPPPLHDAPPPDHPFPDDDIPF
jgi:single-strand DNA-binding protein